jgi:hypothetical protein
LQTYRKNITDTKLSSVTSTASLPFKLEGVKLNSDSDIRFAHLAIYALQCDDDDDDDTGADGDSGDANDTNETHNGITRKNVYKFSFASSLSSQNSTNQYTLLKTLDVTRIIKECAGPFGDFKTWTKDALKNHVYHLLCDHDRVIIRNLSKGHNKMELVIQIPFAETVFLDW